MRSTQRIAIYVVILAQVLLPACSRDSTYHGEAQPGGLFGAFASSFDLGEKAFTVVRSRLAASPSRGVEKTAAFDLRRDDFVNAVNAVVTADSLTLLGPTLRAFFELCDDGTLPAMATNVAEIGDALLAEPDRRTIKALVALSSTRAVVQTDDLLAYIARNANYPEVERVFEAVAELVRENDGKDDQGLPNGEQNLCAEVQAVASRFLKSAAVAPSSAVVGLLDGLPAELLVNAPARGGVPGAMGGPSWAVRVDRNANPQPAKDAQGKLVAPFTDANGDGVADVDADKHPVDASGRVIDLAPFGRPLEPGRDGDGLAVNPGGGWVYDYFDGKQTLLSHFLQLGGESLRRRFHEQGFDVAEMALGARVNNENGTPADASDDYLGFDANNPVADLAWGALEITKFDATPKLLRSIAEIAKTDPALAERVLVTVGRIVEKLRPIALAPSSTPPAQARQLVDRCALLGDRIFTARSTPPSVGRLLFDVLNQLGGSARALPRQLALMARYRKLVVANGLPTGASQPVDWAAAPSTAGTAQGENRSTLQQLLDLLAHADQCRTFVWVGRPLSETIIELMAGRSAGTATSLIGFLGNPIVRAAAGIACPGITNDLDALSGLAASGALEGFLPIAKAFVDKGETRLLVDLLKTIDADYTAVVRPYEAKLADVLDSGAFDAIFDVLDLLVAGRAGRPIADPVSGARAIDLVADSIANLLRHPAGGVADRAGARQPSLFHLLAAPMRRIEDNVNAVSGGQALHTALIYSFTDLGVERIWNDNGTPANPADDFEELRNPSVVPFVSRMLELLARNLPQDAAQRTQRIASAQDSVVKGLAGRDFATAFQLAKTLRFAPQGRTLADALTHVLTPDPIVRDDVFGSLLKLAACALQTTFDAAPLRDLAAFGGELFDPAAGRVVALVSGISRVLIADRGRTLITLVRNALNVPAPAAHLPAGESPAQVLMSVFDDVRAAGNAAGAPSAADQQAELEAFVRDGVAFIRDDKEGLARLFELIRSRPR